MPDGRTLAFVGQDENGVNGIDIQDFATRRDTAVSRRRRGTFDSEIATELFGISSGGKRMTINSWEQISGIVIADGVIRTPALFKRLH
jgi:hypothetical protein